MLREDTEHRCEFEGCNEADFLPTKCNKCRRMCCSAHLAYEAHRCTAFHDTIRQRCPLCNAVVRVPHGQSADRYVSEHIDSGCRTHVEEGGVAAVSASSPFYDPVTNAGISPLVVAQQSARIAAAARIGGKATIDGHGGRLNFCSFKSCTRNEDVLITCPHCSQSFCLAHRSPLDHTCPRMSPPPPAQPVIVDPSKPLTRKVQPALLQKRKFANTMATAYQKDKIEDGITVGIFIGATPAESTAPPFYMTFQRKNPMGLALDKLCRAANVTNNNNSSPSESDRWFIYCLTSGRGVPMEMALEPNMTVEEVAVNGDVWFVGKGPIIPDNVVAEVLSHKLKCTDGQRVSSLSTGAGSGANNIKQQDSKGDACAIS